MGSLSLDERNAVVRGWFWMHLGRGPSADELKFRSDQIAASGLDHVLAALTDSPEAQAFRKRRGW